MPVPDKPRYRSGYTAEETEQVRRESARDARSRYTAASCAAWGGSFQDINHFAQLVLDQAKALYRYWPDVEGRL